MKVAKNLEILIPKSCQSKHNPSGCDLFENNILKATYLKGNKIPVHLN